MNTETFDSLPSYLKKYCVEQDYDAYTPRDHAAWRFIMRQNRDFFRNHAVAIYEEGLRKTGIPIDRIPRISEMDAALRKFGWGATAVCGFIPPAAFLEFQARGVLAIASDMRTVEHIEYTPAPDIVHEAAGHAPIVADPAYAAYLRRYARMAQKAIFAKADIDVYEAIRFLSDIKENPDTTAAEIERAEARFQAATKAVAYVSEATKVSRMAWWTVEYGLVGPMQSPLIYGAGLLSSVGESQNCMSPQVKKIPLDVSCVEVSYDITKPQPQLFVASSMEQLTAVLDEFEQTMCFVRGGLSSLQEGLRSETVNTVVMDSGLAMSGKIEAFEASANGSLEFIKFAGPTQLAYGERELLGQGPSRHSQGFSSPMGRWQGLTERAQGAVTDDDLRRLGIVRGQRASLRFTSGFEVKGTVAGWIRRDGNLLYMTWRNCTVTRGSKVYYQPEWGEFDMAIGEAVTSVFGGPAAREDFGEYDVGKSSTKPGRASPFSEEEVAVFSLYQRLRDLRHSNHLPAADLERELMAIAETTLAEHPEEWLVALEIVELARQKLQLECGARSWLQRLSQTMLATTSHHPPAIHGLIQKGVELAPQQD